MFIGHQPHPVLARFASSARASLLAALTFALTLGIASNLNAQGIAPKPAGPGTLTGVVTDTLGTPIENVDVSIGKLRRRTRTRADGYFRFDSIAPGRYDVSARGVGLVAPSKSVSVGRDGGSVYIRMVRFGNVLAPMVTIASMGGLSGIIGDTAYRAMPDVKVTVIGGGQTAHTDSTGAFYMPLKPGQYMLRIERDGYARQIAGVSIPENEGRRIAAWMVPQDGGGNPLDAVRLYDLNERIMRLSPASSKYIAREELLKLGIYDLQDLTRRWASGRVTPACSVQINGGPQAVPLASLSTSELEFVEIYLPTFGTGGSSTTRVTSVYGHPTTSRTSTSVRPSAAPNIRGESNCGSVSLIAWLRQ